MLIYMTCTNIIKIIEFSRTEEHLEISRFAPSMKELRWRQAHTSDDRATYHLELGAGRPVLSKY